MVSNFPNIQSQVTAEKEEIRLLLEEYQLGKKSTADDDDKRSQSSDDSHSQSRESVADEEEINAVGGKEEFHGQLQVLNRAQFVVTSVDACVGPTISYDHDLWACMKLPLLLFFFLLFVILIRKERM